MTWFGRLLATAAVAGATALSVPAHSLEEGALPTSQCKSEAAMSSARHLSSSLNEAVSVANEILSEHHLRADVSSDGAHYQVDVEFDHLRDVDVPHPDADEIYYLTDDTTALFVDDRSRINPLWKVYENTVIAADLAYEITFDFENGIAATGVLDRGLVQGKLPGYRVEAVYADAYSGFAGMALEYTGGGDIAPHRIYGIAGSHVFYHTDLRTWASGMTMGRAQFVSTEALRMVRDAADYASAGSAGGEVFVTGQSQGGLTCQGIGYLIQAYLDSLRHQNHHLVHVVSWGAIGALEAIARMIEADQRGDRRDFPASLERHWAFTEPSYASAMPVWDSVSRHWSGLETDKLHDHVMETAGRMGTVGFFFDIDLFAKAGTFIGPTLAFPSELLIPDLCEMLVAEREAGIQGGDLGIELEGHFLNGYERAVDRGGLALAKPATVAKWDWVIDMLPTFEEIGSIWLTILYEDRLAASTGNWQYCLQAGEWRTNRNSYCEETWWPGCGPVDLPGWDNRMSDAASPAAWCLITKEAEL